MDIEAWKEELSVCGVWEGYDIYYSQREDSGKLYFSKVTATVYPTPHAHLTA